MPKFDHHFLPLSPPPSSRAELDALEIVWSCIVYLPNSAQPVCVRFLGNQHFIQVIAVTVPEAERANEHLQEWFKQIFETSIAALRLSVQPQATPIYLSNGFVTAVTQTADPEPIYGLIMDVVQNSEYRLNNEHLGGVFEALFCKPFSSAAALFAESQLNHLPVHYRVLSLVRTLECLYPTPSDRNAALESFEAEFASLKISKRKFVGALPEIRTRCAHGVSNGRTPPKPFVGIGYDNGQLHHLIGLLTSVVIRGFHSIHDLPIERAKDHAVEY